MTHHLRYTTRMLCEEFDSDMVYCVTFILILELSETQAFESNHC